MVNIVNQYPKFKNTMILQEISEFIEEVLKDFGRGGRVMNIVLCDDGFIRDLNRDYRGFDKPTDVLSFSMEEGEVLWDGDDDSIGEVPVEMGDVMISVDTAGRQAVEYNVPLEEELVRLSVHGALHLLGLDHEISPEEEEAMMKKQDELIAEFFRKYSL
ncbi:MAG: rRNA maturation RNase YbeY [Spirochaetes bacterium GWF1_51_8]|nr:MAG: rRNA maturation RNase YbeY [Spirochaetes bacterium GWF1_51_8]